ncbi:DUF1801 domain-containing protein [Haploplasma axanthum]|uniref:Uncharacterized conserved protein n=1 Tax=Haploplasma axanthum TaxID=29552 RepID=A0A449BFM9_HAPAX|nr:DUF1801 domain-containing protein [Haploplasma axanthum]VEU81267.1 Uncharacterized conserved protein [Haploplasma axanthum]
MIEDVEYKLEKFNDDLKSLFITVRNIIFEVEPLIEERLWASLPSYYKDKNFIRLIPFKTYINIEAKAISLHIDELNDYQITPKGMMKIFVNQPIPYKVLKMIFIETLQ